MLEKGNNKKKLGMLIQSFDWYLRTRIIVACDFDCKKAEVDMRSAVRRRSVENVNF